MNAKIYGALDAVQNTTILDRHISEYLRNISFNNFVFHGNGWRFSGRQYLRLSYPKEWVERYVDSDYFTVDPVERASKAARLPFDWSGIGNLSRSELVVMDEFRAINVGRSGLSIPLFDERGRAGLFSVTSCSVGNEWSEIVKCHIGDLVVLANFVHAKICELDVTDTLTMALQASGCDSATVVQRPRLLSDNGPSYVSSDLAAWLGDQGMDHTRGSPAHPQTQGSERGPWPQWGRVSPRRTSAGTRR